MSSEETTTTTTTTTKMAQFSRCKEHETPKSYFCSVKGEAVCPFCAREKSGFNIYYIPLIVSIKPETDAFLDKTKAQIERIFKETIDLKDKEGNKMEDFSKKNR